MQKIIVILGPTAAGKTSMSLALAKKFNGYIISADSRQIYKEMDIGTDKLTKDKWQDIEHRMIDILEPDQEYSLAQYQKTVQTIIKHENKLLPFLVGGTGLYIQSIVDNLNIPKGGPDRALRKELGKKDTEELFTMLIEIDPKAAQMIDMNNKRRLIRAIEVCKNTNTKFSDQIKKKKPVVDALQIGVSISREEMYSRINNRVDEMMNEGLLKEVETLGKKYGWGIPSMSAIGYKQLGLYFKKELTLEEAVELIKIDSRHYAKRQMTWFKRDERINWISSIAEAEELIQKFIN